MRKIGPTAVLAAFLIFSCTPEDIASKKEVTEGQSSLSGPQESEQDSLIGPQIVRNTEFYVAGVQFPQNYDWRKDIEYGFIQSSMFLESGGERLFDFEAGYESQISTDADMVRCVGNHIYTDFSTDYETIIKCDGVELFRFSGREMIVGLVVLNDNVYTLGVPREGTGWVYRQNGVASVYSDKGEILRSLYVDAGIPVFSYKVEPEPSSDEEASYFVVSNGVAKQVFRRAPYGDIIDILVCSGKQYVLHERTPLFPAVIEADGELRLVFCTKSKIPGVAYFMESDGEDVYVAGHVFRDGGLVLDALWSYGENYTFLEDGLDIKYLYPFEGKFLIICTKRDDPSAWVIYYDGAYIDVDEGYEVSSRQCAAFVDGHCCVALNPVRPGSPPYYLLDVKRHVVEVNGWLSGVGCVLTEYQISQDMVLDKSGLTDI